MDMTEFSSVDRASSGKHRNIFTALHGMQARSNDEISVCPSVRPSVCQTREL